MTSLESRMYFSAVVEFSTIKVIITLVQSIYLTQPDIFTQTDQTDKQTDRQLTLVLVSDSVLLYFLC